MSTPKRKVIKKVQAWAYPDTNGNIKDSVVFNRQTSKFFTKVTILPTSDYKAMLKELRAYKKLAKSERIEGYIHEYL